MRIAWACWLCPAFTRAESAQGIYEITEAGLRSEDTSVEEQKQFVGSQVNITKTLSEIFTAGLNISTSLLPFVSDARDYYELISGKDLITGETLDTFARVVTGVAVIAGSGVLYRKIANKLKDSFKPKSNVSST
jgi:hypothetical protein